MKTVPFSGGEVPGHVDAGSLHGVIETFDHSTLMSCPLWAAGAARDLTCLLLSGPAWQVTPGPSAYRGAHGHYRYLLTALKGLVLEESAPREVVRRGIQDSAAWVEANPRRARRRWRRLTMSRAYQGWLDWVVRRDWENRLAMFGQLFERDLIPLIADVLNAPISELESAWKAGHSQRSVRQFTRRGLTGHGVQGLLQDAFSVAVAARGRFHDYVARTSHASAYHHPVWQTFLDRRKVNVRVEATNTEAALAGIIVSSAYAVRRVPERISIWAENLLRVRTALRSDRVHAENRTLELEGKASDLLARRRAVEVAERCQVDVRGAIQRKLDPWAAMLGSTVAFLISLWTDRSPAEAATDAGSAGGAVRLLRNLDKTWVGRALRRRRLRAMLEYGPGRIRQPWWT